MAITAKELSQPNVLRTIVWLWHASDVSIWKVICIGNHKNISRNTAVVVSKAEPCVKGHLLQVCIVQQNHRGSYQYLVSDSVHTQVYV